MDRSIIEKVVDDLRREMWKQKALLWPGGNPQLIDLTEPEVAARLRGVRFQYFEELGLLEHGTRRYETAGLIDRRNGMIAVSMKFSFVERRFTGAHEIGHWLLHPGLVMHRDRPLGLQARQLSRSAAEREADYFAACFLMPADRVIREFEARFYRVPFVFDENAAFFLNPQEPDSLLRPYVDSMGRALALAGATSYGRPITPLTERFRVSRTAMAIRIEELGLIQG